MTRAVAGLTTVDEDGELVDYAHVFKTDPGHLWQLPVSKYAPTEDQVAAARILLGYAPAGEGWFV